MTESRTYVQSDFSLGQVTPTALRRMDSPQMRRAVKEAINFQSMVAGGAEARAGRSALYLSGPRNDEVTMPPGTDFKLEFAPGILRIRSVSANAVVATFTDLPWDAPGIPRIRWTLFSTEIIITYTGMRPQVVSYISGTGAWSISDFGFQDGVSTGQLRQPYYRFADTLGITMQPSARTGSVTVVFSADVLTPGYVGVRFRYANEELVITSVTDPQNGTADVIKKLPPSGQVTLGTPDGFDIGDVIEGETSGCKAVITGVSGSDITFVITKNFSGFKSGELIISPSSKSGFSAPNYALSPEPTTFWDEELISGVRGWPGSCAVDARRLIFCQFASAPNVVAWGAIGVYNDFFIGTEANDAFVETLAGQATVLDVIGGADEFVLCTTGVYYIPISTGNPLKPGSIEFRFLGTQGAANLAPTPTSEGVLYINASRTRIMAIVGTGQSARPYLVRDLTTFHADLITGPVCIAVSVGEGAEPEQYVWVVNVDGTMAVGRYDASEELVGWFPWRGAGLVKWASAKSSRPLFTTAYGPVTVAEEQNSTALLDAEVPAASPPVQLAPPIGHGPFWMFPSQTLSLRRSRRPIGTRTIDADGNVIWQDNDENRTLDSLIAGFEMTPRSLLPFLPHVAEGEVHHQHMRKRKIARAAVTVQNSTGFVFGKRRIGMDTIRDDRSMDPVAREGTYTFRPAGRSFDPSVGVTCDVPGTLQVIEIAYEVTV